MKQVLEDCLKAARERYSGAQRFAFLIVAVFLAVHLTTVMQYLRREPAVRQASKDAETADSFSEATRQIAISTAELAQEEAHQTETIIRKFIDKLKTDLRQVDDAIVRARGLPTDSENQDIRLLQLQQQQQNVRDIIPELPQEFSEKLRSIQDNHAIRELLAPWIEEHVIQLRLDELRDAWEKEVWPKLAAIGVNINSWIDEAAKVWPKDPNLRDLETQVKVFVESGALLNFATPTDHAWWSTYQGKDSAGRYLDENVASALHLELIYNAAKSLQTAADKANTKANAILASAERAKKALDKSFEEQKKRADELAQPLSFLAIDLAMLVETFPFILGVALGVGFFWVSWRRRELAQAWAALAKSDAEWQHGAEAIGLAHGRRKEFIVAFIAALFWITFASWQLSVSGVVPPLRATELGALGICFLTVGAAWHWRQNRHVDKIISNTG